MHCYFQGKVYQIGTAINAVAKNHARTNRVRTNGIAVRLKEIRNEKASNISSKPTQATIYISIRISGNGSNDPSERLERRGKFSLTNINSRKSCRKADGRWFKERCFYFNPITFTLVKRSAIINSNSFDYNTIHRLGIASIYQSRLI